MLTGPSEAHRAPLERAAISLKGYKHRAPPEHFAAKATRNLFATPYASRIKLNPLYLSCGAIGFACFPHIIVPEKNCTFLPLTKADTYLGNSFKANYISGIE